MRNRNDLGHWLVVWCFDLVAMGKQEDSKPSSGSGFGSQAQATETRESDRLKKYSGTAGSSPAMPRTSLESIGVYDQRSASAGKARPAAGCFSLVEGRRAKSTERVRQYRVARGHDVGARDADTVSSSTSDKSTPSSSRIVAATRRCALC